MKEVIAATHPIIVCELHRSSTCAQAVAMIADALSDTASDYEFSVLEKGTDEDA